MKAIKTSTYPLDKCYAIGRILYRDKPHIVIAAEKEGACLLFTEEGQFVETIWQGPSGTMSIVPLNDKDGSFLATKNMFSPNDGDKACIVSVQPAQKNWQTKTIAKVPYAHRFDVLVSQNKRYLVCATIKKACEYKEDWRYPGQYLACELPENLSGEQDLKPRLIADGLLKNHGYIRRTDTQGDYSVISCHTGVFEMHPPQTGKTDWTIRQLIGEPVSDIAFTDFDGDGRDEMITLSPFHGDTVKIFKQKNGQWTCVYEHPEKLPFVHSIWAGKIKDKNLAVIGHRKGDSRDLYAFFYEDGTYKAEVLDKDCGSTNVLVYDVQGIDYLVSTNREINEIAFYRLEP
ncbi:hypothetical protein V1L52_01745 [Treponema sp. HNW]|uniref:hypothetical protein n=1 Tax=Treponema sp. HNW TaxID=3116654 RepID=UPI003D0BC81B